MSFFFCLTIARSCFSTTFHHFRYRNRSRHPISSARRDSLPVPVWSTAASLRMRKRCPRVFPVAPLSGFRRPEVISPTLCRFRSLSRVLCRVDVELTSDSPWQYRTLGQCDNDNLKSHKYVCITAYQPDTKSNTSPITLLNSPKQCTFNSI